jgi:hypothetical protein
MSLSRRIANLFSRSKVEREIDAELRSHIEMRIEDNIAGGMSPERARRDALLRFGNPALMKERVAGADTALNLDSVWADVRYAFRQMRRSPGFVTTSVLILALGIGASTAIFSAVNPILFEPLPYPHANRITMIWEMQSDGSPSAVTFGTFHGPNVVILSDRLWRRCTARGKAAGCQRSNSKHSRDRGERDDPNLAS